VSCVREVSRTLRPATLDLGLLPALRALAHDLSMRSDVDVLAELPSTLPDLPPATAQALFRIAQEALTNALRHAGAHRLTLRLLRTGVGLELQVEDDGCGFDIVQDNARRGLGLLGMRERASRAGAVLAVRSAAGLGTRVCAELALATTPKGPP
jgi:signal transduction histidine kinase